MWKYLLAWVPMVVIAVANGALRQVWFGKHLSELQAHQVSTLSGLVLLGLYMWLVIRVWRPASSRQALAIGLTWLGLTVGFEFIFMHYAAGVPWSRLLQDYNVLAGRVWVAVLVWVAAAPYLFYRMQR